jgi:hypothetical protein
VQVPFLSSEVDLRSKSSRRGTSCCDLLDCPDLFHAALVTSVAESAASLAELTASLAELAASLAESTASLPELAASLAKSTASLVESDASLVIAASC